MFTAQCFIRKNTPELREKLIQLGYKNNPLNSTDYRKYGIICRNNHFVGVPQNDEEFSIDEYLNKFNYIINCENNEELFLALAALRDDTDKDQWFTNGTDWCIQREIKNYDDTITKSLEFSYLPTTIDYVGNSYHKATIEELIEYFKK